MTPTQRSLRLLREQGYVADVVEQRIPGTNRSRDLFGIIDIVAIGNGQTLGVQTTDASNVSHRRNKMIESETLSILNESGWLILIHGWRKDGRLREEVVR